MALRARSKSCALSARFFPPSIPADVTANARLKCTVRKVYKPCQSNPNLELLVDALQTIGSGVKVANLVGLHLHLLLEILDLAFMSLTFCNVLSFQFVLMPR